MKKNILLLLFITYSISSQIRRPQNFCKTSTNYVLPNLSAINTANRNNICNLKVYLHIITDSNGNSEFTEFDAYESLRILDNAFNPIGINFDYALDIDYIRNNALYIEITPEVFNINNHEDGIDIYFSDYTNLTFGGEAGWPSTSTTEIPSDFYVGRDPFIPGVPAALTNIIGHEMGHVLGLWHTDRGCETGDFELIDGSNSATAGDEVRDTPADPFIGYEVNRRCEFTPTSSTPFCAPPEPRGNYNPDTKNFMAHTLPKCMSRFSNGQGARMHNAIATLPPLINATISCTPNPDCSVFPKIFERIGATKQNPYNIAIDSNDDIIITNVNKNYVNVNLDGVNIDFEYFMAKYDKEGCLLWAKETSEGYSFLKVDNDDIYIKGYSKIEKFSKDGDLLWTAEVNSPFLITNFTFGKNNNIYFLQREASSNSNNTNKLFKLNKLNGLYQEISTSLPPDDFSINNIYVSKTNNDVFLGGTIDSSENEFNFGSSLIFPPTPHNPFFYRQNPFLLKYSTNSSGTILTPDKAFLINVPSHLSYNSNTNRFLRLNYINYNLEFLNSNFNPLGQVTLDFSGHIVLKENTLLIINEGTKLHKIKDNDLYQLETISLNIPNIQNKYAHINFDQASDKNIYITWTNSGPLAGNWDMNFQKINSNTGQLLSRLTNIKEIKSNDLFFESKTSLVKIYPNPTNDNITISSEKEIEQIQILSKISLPLISKNKISKKEITIDIESFPTDIYVIKVLFKDGTIKEQKILKE